MEAASPSATWWYSRRLESSSVPLRVPHIIWSLCYFEIQILVVLVLCDFVLCDFTLTQLENLHHFLKLHDHFCFKAMWHRRSVVAFVFCRRLAGSDVTVTPCVTCMDWLHWWHSHTAHLVSCSTALAFLTNMSEKRRSASPIAIQVKNRRKTIGIEEELHVISWLGKGERIVDTCRNVRLAISSVHTVCHNADRIKESAKSGTKVFVCVARLPQTYRNEPFQKLWMCVSYSFIVLDANKYIV
jgi:hypothetical protein